MWINPTSLKIFKSHSEIRSFYNNISFPSILSDDSIETFLNLKPVLKTKPETFDPFIQIAEEITPVQIGGVWTQQWIIRDLTPEEQQEKIPKSIEVLQGLLAIDQVGLSSLYESWINSPERTFAEKAFINNARTWRRDDPILQAAATEIGLTKEQLDQLFILASKF